MPKTKTKKLRKLKNISDEAWKYYSIYRRSKEADFSGYVKCYTCGKSLLWKEANLGHFKHNKLDFDPDNTRIQCVACNHHNSGKLDVYALKLIDEIGLERVKDLERRAAQFIRYTREELNGFLETYKAKVKLTH